MLGILLCRTNLIRQLMTPVLTPLKYNKKKGVSIGIVISTQGKEIFQFVPTHKDVTGDLIDK